MSDDFIAVERMEKIYGQFPEKERNWIEDNLQELTDEQKGKYYSAIQKTHEAENGYPEISVMAEVFKKVMNKAPKKYAWSVCKECGCEYDYKLPCCPACYSKGLFCNVIAVKSSDCKPKIIQYNKTYLREEKGDKVCYNCIHKEGSYCKHFGDPFWNCKREEFEACNCKTCCAIMKRANRQIEGDKETEKLKYAVPLKRF